MGVLVENAGFLLLAAFLILLVMHIYSRAKHKKGFLWELCFLGVLSLFSIENMGPTRNSLYVGPILFTSEKPSPLMRMFSGKSKIFAIENHGKETLLTSVSAFSDRVISQFKVLEGEEYLKERRDGPRERTLALAIPAGKRVGIQTSEEVVLQPHNVHALQFGIHGYYPRRSELPPVSLK